jgi:hypothetical protein
MTADATERLLTDRAVEAASAGTVLAVCAKPLSTDTTVGRELMTFDFIAKLARAAVAVKDAESTAQADAAIATVLKSVPRLLTVRNAEKDDDSSRQPVVDLLRDAAERDKLLKLAQDSADAMNASTNAQLSKMFRKRARCGDAADSVWDSYSKRNGPSLSILPHSFTASVLVDCVQLADSPTAAATEASLQALSSVVSSHELLSATGIPALIAQLMQPGLEALSSLLQPLVALLKTVSAGSDVAVHLRLGGVADAEQLTTDTNSSSDSSGTMSAEQQRLVTEVLSLATSLTKSKWSRGDGGGSSRGRGSKARQQRLLLKDIEYQCDKDADQLINAARQKIKVIDIYTNATHYTHHSIKYYASCQVPLQLPPLSNHYAARIPA